MTDQDRITRGRMGRIDQLDEDLRETINRMLRGGNTQKRILEIVNASLEDREEAPIGAASLNRYVNRPAIRALAERARVACEIGDAIAQSTEEGRGAKLDRGLVQAGQTLAMEALAEIDWTGFEAEDRVKMIANFGLAVRRFAASQALADARERAIRADAATKAAKAAVDAAGREAANSGAPFSPEALRRIREEVYGIVEEPVA